MRWREIIESASTTSGGIATVAMPMGNAPSMQTRNGGNFFTGKYTTDPFPNTPKRMKRKKK